MTFGLSRPRAYVAALTCILIFVMALFGVRAVSAGAAEWGELSHVALPVSAGTESDHIHFTGAGSVLAFAADTTDRAFYVGDEPTPGEYRIQRFGAAGQSEGEPASFTPPSVTRSGSEFNAEGLQLAVDQARNRVYALVLYKRRGQDSAEATTQAKEEAQQSKEEEEEREGKKPHDTRLIKQSYERTPLDSMVLAATRLYAFEYTSGKLVSFKGTTEAEPIVEALKAQGENPKEALLDPRGLAVEPTTGNVAIVGAQDEEANEPVEKGEAERQCRAAVQFVVIEKKTGKLGARFADTSDALSPDNPGCGTAQEEELPAEKVPLSPAFSPGGNLLISSDAEKDGSYEGSIWEIATPPSESVEHKEVAATPKLLFEESKVAPLLQILSPEGGAGPNMSFVPEGAQDGRIYISAKYEVNASALLALQYTGEGDGKPAQVTELGWTAGASASSACGVPQPSGLPVLLGGFNEGAGKAEGVTAFDPYIEGSTPRIEDYAYGPGSSTTGCPKPSVETPTATVGEDKNAHEAHAGELVVLSSKLSGANAESVEWKLKYKNSATGEENAETISAGAQTERSMLEHAFKEGEYAISEIVHTDDLAYPEVAAAEVLQLTITAKPIGIKFTVPDSIRVNEEEASIEAKVNDENEEANKLTLKRIVWSFGDGSAPVETYGTPEEPNPTVLHVKHVFASRCPEHEGRCSISLTVEDARGAVKKATVSIAVSESKAEEERKAQEEAAAKAKAEEEARHKVEAEAAQHKAEEEAVKKHQEEEAAAKKHQEEAEAAARKKREEEEKAKAKPPTRAQLLAKALKQCQKEPKSKRAKCKARAHKKYGSKPKRKKKKK